MSKPFTGDYSEIDDWPDALSRRPQLAAHIGVVASLWSRVDASFGYLFVHFSKCDDDIAIDKYLTRQTRKRENGVLVDAASAADLDPDLRREAFELIDKRLDHAKRRDEIVHGIWGISRVDPNVLFRMGQKTEIKESARAWAGATFSAGGMNKVIGAQKRAKLFEVFDECDFVDIEETFEIYDLEIKLVIVKSIGMTPGIQAIGARLDELRAAPKRYRQKKKPAG